MGETGYDPQYRNILWDSARWDGFEPRDDDIVISTPPKCGTTWMQMQVALLLFRTPALPDRLSVLSPWLDANMQSLDDVCSTLAAQTRRRFIKTHTPLTRLPRRAGVTFLHVGRDPGDVALSWDDHLANVDMARVRELRAEALGADGLARLGPGPAPPPDDPVARFWLWMEGDAGRSSLRLLVHHHRTFWDARDEAGIHLFHYSDMRDDLAGQMTRLADALGVDPPTDELVEAARFETMKARAADLVPGSDNRIWRDADGFFQQGRRGAWREVMGDDATRYEAALRALTDDEALIAWMHDGWLGRT